MSYRDGTRRPVILSALFEQKADTWGEATRKVAMTDAQRMLEALVAEVGFEATLQAMENQGFESGAYRYLLAPLHAEAVRRRGDAKAADSATRD